MRCTDCGTDNREGRKFCAHCGVRLALWCPDCSAENEPGEKFCGECGAPLNKQPQPVVVVEPAGARKIVTILFADLVGSTALHERLDPESARRFIESYYAAAREAVESHGGVVAKLLGDGAMAVFGMPRVAEDDAIRAVRAGVAMQEAFRTLAERQRAAVGSTGLRVAINTGEVVVKGETEIIGDPVNVAARLQERARDGDVVVGEATQRLVASKISLEPLGSFDLKGRAEAVRAYRVLSIDAARRAAATAFVGRVAELGRINAVFDRAVAAPAAHMAVLLGSPGLGKSRLIAEFARRRGDTARIVAAHCDAAGGATFAPIADAVREILAIETGAAADSMRATVEAALPESEAERKRIAAGIAGLLSGTPGAPEETFFVVRRFLAGLAATHPVVLLIDDLQWAEPLLLDLVEHLVQWGRGLPLLVLIGARPELREVRSSLATPGGLVADVVPLDGLDAGAAMQLAAGVIGATDLPAAVAAKVLATSEGNPLFIAELVRMLVDEGALTRDGDRWTAGAALATVEMPPTIHAVLAARIERLAPQDCAILERAAVVGRHFSRSALAALLPSIEGGLDARLESLQRAELIERDTGWLLGEPALRFHHVLIRDAAYRRLLKGTRAELHERLASWIEKRAGDAPEHDETIGRHLEEAHRLLGELGPLDDAGRRLGERASTHLAAAGRRALEGDDVTLGAGLLGRALGCLTADDAGRSELALDWCEAVLAAGDVTGAATAIDELARLMDGSERLRAWHTCFAGHHTVLTAPEGLSATVERVAAAATSLASLDDAAGEAKAHFVHALALARLGKVGPCEASLDHALAAARRAGDRRRANTVLAIAPLAALWGPSPVTRASGRCLDVVRVLRITQGAPAVEAVALSCQGVLEALRGRTDAARRMIASARKMVEELGIAGRLFETDVFAGFVAMLEGDAPAATERTLRGAYEGLRDLGLGIDTARAAALLARALLAEGRIDEAEKLSRESETLAGDDLKAAIAWRGVRAEALARRGEHVSAIELARTAVEIAAATDALLDHADARLALAAALRASGRGAEADEEERRAIELWEAKGASLLVERARRATAPAMAMVAASALASNVGQAPRRRPVRHNFAVEEARRVEAAVAARDVEAVAAVYRSDVVIVDHLHGVEHGRDGVFERVRAVIEQSTDGAFRHETLAALGDSLALCRLRSTASGSVIYGIPLGATEINYLLVIEADERGSARRIEIFGETKLGDAVVRLYELYAAEQPEGPARMRWETIALAVSTIDGPVDLEHMAANYAPDLRLEDHRVLATWSCESGAELVEHFRHHLELAPDFAGRMDEVLALESDLLVARITYVGTGRDSGGAFENRICVLYRFDDEGRMASIDCYEAEHAADALARFDDLVAGALVRPPVRRRIRPNAASTVAQRIEAGFTAHDRDAIVELLADPLHTVEHPTGGTYERDGQIESIERMLRLPNLEFRLELLATLGEYLSLARRRVAASGTAGGRFDVADFEQDHIVLTEVDEHGRLRRSEVFSPNRLSDAIHRLYERQAEILPDGPERDRAERTAKTVRAVLTPCDLDTIAPALDPDVETVDHRTLGTWSARGARAALEQIDGLLDVSLDAVVQDEDILALGPDGLLVRRMHSGTERVGGGIYEREFLFLLRLGVDGRLSRWEFFDVGEEAQALERFDELTAGSADGDATPRFSRRAVPPNAATEIVARIESAAAARDFAALRALFRDDYEEINHSTGSSFGLDEALASVEGLFRSRNPYFKFEAVATLGPFSCLGRRRAGASGVVGRHVDIGDYDNGALQLYEVDERGLMRRSEAFAVDRLGDAIARLYERHAESLPEGPGRDRAAGIARSLPALDGPIDPDRVAAAFHPASRNVDHRIFGTWSTRDTAEVVRHYRQQLELAPDFAARFGDVLALEPDALLVRMSFFGTGRDSGGAFENPILLLITFCADGRMGDTETFEAEREADALARFDEIRAGETGPHLVGSTAATTAKGTAAEFQRAFSDRSPVRAWNRADGFRAVIIDAWHARDWPTVERLFDDDFRFSDRRPLILLDLDRDGWMNMSRRLGDMDSSRLSVETIATRGERLVLWRVRIEVAGGDVGPSLVEHLNLFETNEAGDRMVWAARFETTDVAAAYAELDQRFEAGEAASYPNVLRSLRTTRFLETRDWQAWAAALAPDFRYRDHRRLGFGNTVGDADGLLHLMQSTVELAPDAHYRNDHVRISPCGNMRQTVLTGTRDGGAFESPMLLVFEVDEEGKTRRADSYDIVDRDRALARAAELGITIPSSGRELAARCRTAPVTSGSTSAEPNAASRWLERFRSAFNARDFDTLDTLLAPNPLYEDRQRHALVSGGSDVARTSVVARAEAGFLLENVELLGTAGDRIAIQRLHWAKGGDEDRAEAEIVVVQEVDETGRICASINFDPEDTHAAQREAWARWAAIDPDVAAVATPIWNAIDAFNEQSAEKWRAAHAEDIVVIDHRLAGMGRIEGIDTYTESLIALWKLAPVTRADLGWQWPALDRHGAITVLHRTGTVPDGGGDFESEYLYLCLTGQGRITRVELFEMSAPDKALARFEELRPSAPSVPQAGADPLRIPPNAATRAVERYIQAALTGDAETVVALLDPSYTLDDRRRMIRTTTDRSAEIAVHVPWLYEGGWQAEQTLLATAGDRLALQRILWTTGDAGARSEVEMLELDEVDGGGRFVRSLIFDPDQQAAAYQELFERYVALGADEVPQGAIEFMRGWNSHDLARARGGLCDDFVLIDHRRTGMGRVEGADSYIESLAALHELIPDGRADGLYDVAAARHGSVRVSRTWGHNSEGAEVESVLVALVHHPGDKLSLMEFFEVEQLDAALARFEELRTESSGATFK